LRLLGRERRGRKEKGEVRRGREGGVMGEKRSGEGEGCDGITIYLEEGRGKVSDKVVDKGDVIKCLT
jgi:hypothetical protein